MSGFTRLAKPTLIAFAVASVTVAATATSRDARAEGELNVYNWSDYIGETTVDDFQKATGITVRYDVYDSNETLESKLMAGSTGYDIVVPSGSFLGRQIQAGIYQKIDKSKLKNYGNIDPQILEALATFDPGNEYAVPYFWGTVGIGVNVDKVKERLGDNAPVDSLDLLFKPENAAKLQDCGISMLDAPSDMFQTALKYLGKDPHSKSEEDYAAVEQLFAGVRPYIKYFHSSQYINDLANGRATCSSPRRAPTRPRTTCTLITASRRKAACSGSTRSRSRKTPKMSTMH
jgi:putrescine transport system substrate-binding protein